MLPDPIYSITDPKVEYCLPCLVLNRKEGIQSVQQSLTSCIQYEVILSIRLHCGHSKLTMKVLSY